MFCYFLPLFFLVSCADGAKKETESKVETGVTETNNNNKKETIIFFGTSLTAGLGLDTTEAYPAIIQQKIDSLGLNYQVVNAGLSGETSASGKNRINWVLNQNVSVFVLELGANDGLRGIPLSETENNLQEIIDAVLQKNKAAKIVLAGMQMPPNLGEEYTTEFKNLFPNLAQKNKLYLIPFLLQDVGGIPELNQQDGIHPTAQGQQIIAHTVWKTLQPLL
jgi:acyl-CoA thioesterase-1